MRENYYTKEMQIDTEELLTLVKFYKKLSREEVDIPILYKKRNINLRRD